MRGDEGMPPEFEKIVVRVPGFDGKIMFRLIEQDWIRPGMKVISDADGIIRGTLDKDGLFRLNPDARQQMQERYRRFNTPELEAINVGDLMTCECEYCVEQRRLRAEWAAHRIVARRAQVTPNPSAPIPYDARELAASERQEIAQRRALYDRVQQRYDDFQRSRRRAPTLAELRAFIESEPLYYESLYAIQRPVEGGADCGGGPVPVVAPVGGVADARPIPVS